MVEPLGTEEGAGGGVVGGPKISQLLPCMLQFLDNLCRIFIFSTYIGEIDHFMLDLLKSSDA